MKKTCHMIVVFLLSTFLLPSKAASVLAEYNTSSLTSGSISSLYSDKISDEEIDSASKAILEPLRDGFQIADVVSIISNISDYVEKKHPVNNSEKRNITSKILCHIIDITDTPGLPDFIFDGIFKALVPQLVAVMYPDKKIVDATYSQLHSIELIELEKAIDGFFSEIHDGFTLDDIPRCISYAAKFFSGYSYLTREEKKSAAKQLFFKVIDETDTPYLPDFFFDDIFKQIGSQMIDYLIDHQIIL